MRHYHTTECIIDLLAASSPQSFYGFVRESRRQVTAPWESAYPTTGCELAVAALVDAGLIKYEVDGAYYDLTDYGYIVIASHQTPAFKANVAAHVTEIAEHWEHLEQSWTRPPGGRHECD